MSLYQKIEQAIIVWNNDGTKTAGSLTRQIMKIINEEKKKDKTMKLSKKWKEIWTISALCLIGSIFIFKYDPGFAGYLLGIAIMFPSVVWYFDNQY